MDTKPGKKSNLPSIFISYSHADEAWKDRVVKQLRVLESEGHFEVWDDRRIAAGDDWYPAIERALTEASAAILLISDDFLTSPFILGEEVPRLLKRRKEEGLRVIPLIVRPCAWRLVSWLKSIQSCPVDGRALAKGDEYQIDQDLADLVTEIYNLFKASQDSPWLAELKNLLQQAAIPEYVVHRVFHAYLQTLGEQANWVLPDFSVRSLWDCLFDYLLDPSWMKSSGQHHLINFISRLAPYVSLESQRYALQDWTCKTATELGISMPKSSGIDDIQEEPQPYLLFAVSPEGGYYTLRAWFTDSPGVFDDIGEKTVGSNLDDLPEHLKEVLDNPKVTNASLRGNAPILEFFLPVNLLNRNIDHWTPSGEKRPLSTKYGLVVRAGERLWKKYWIPDWGRTWKDVRYVFGEKASRRRTVWLTGPEYSCCTEHLDKGQFVIGLWFVPNTDCFETLLDSGVSILLWPRVELERAVQAQLKRQLANQAIRTLPEWLRKWRAKQWSESRQTGPLSLLWDDPQRLPDNFDNYEPMESHPDL